MKKRYWILSTVLSLTLLLSAGLLTGCIPRMFVYPGTSGLKSDDYYKPFFDAKDYVEFTAKDGKIMRGWLVNRGQNAPLVAMYGGNAMHVGSFYDFVQADKTRSYLLLNYRGYGGSEGSPSQSAIVEDALMALSWAKQKLGRPSKVTLVGFSLGTGVAMQVAAKQQTDGIMLICPFDSLAEVAREHMGSWAAFFVQHDAYNSAELAPSITCPVTIIAGKQDKIVPPKHTEKLIKAFKLTQPQVHWLEAGHNDIMSLPEFVPLYKQGLKK